MSHFNPPARKVLIIGGGFSGMAAAIQLRKQGVAVDIVEADSGWRSYGAGISLHGATLRAFGTLGILDAFLEQGCGTDGLDLCTPSGQPIAQIPTPRVAGAHVPGGGGILRPTLARILAAATRASDARVFLGCSFTAIEQDADGVEVSFTDGQRRRYDLVIGADGLYSKTRAALFPDAPRPRFTGQAVWRAVLPRPADLQRPVMWMGLPRIKVGVNPVSGTEMYLFVTEDRPTNAHVDPAHFAALLGGLLAPFPAPAVQALREQITNVPAVAASIVYRPLEGLLLQRPWFHGRMVLIGDAVHATTPHLAAGACIGIEDAIVLAEELGHASDLQHGLQAFQARRWERCRMVVENSLRIGALEVNGGDKAEQQRILGQSMAALAQPL